VPLCGTSTGSHRAYFKAAKRDCVQFNPGVCRRELCSAEEKKTEEVISDPDRGSYPPPCFLGKRLQAIENKRNARVKEGKERKRGGKLLQQLNLPQRHRIQGGRKKEKWGDTPPPPFSVVWQTKALQRGSFECVAMIGVTGRFFGSLENETTQLLAWAVWRQERRGGTNRATFTKSVRKRFESDDHDPFYLAHDASETGPKCKNEHLSRNSTAAISFIFPGRRCKIAAHCFGRFLNVVDKDAVGCLP
jgi:hypothetical protein